MQRDQLIVESESGGRTQASVPALDTQWEMLLSATTSELHHNAEIPTTSDPSNNQLDLSSTFHCDADLLNAFVGAEPLFDNVSYSYDGEQTFLLSSIYTLPREFGLRNVDFDSNISLLGWMNSESATTMYNTLPDLNVLGFNMQGSEDPLRASRGLQIPMNSTQPPDNNAEGVMIGAALSPASRNPAQSSSPNIDNSTLPTPAASLDPGTGSSLEEAADTVPPERITDTWPYEGQAGASETRISFPALDLGRKLYQGSRGTSSPSENSQLFHSLGKLDDDKRNSIIQLLSLPLIRIPWIEDADLLRSLPSPEILDHFTNLYFLHFHDVSQSTSCILSLC